MDYKYHNALGSSGGQDGLTLTLVALCQLLMSKCQVLADPRMTSIGGVSANTHSQWKLSGYV